MEIATMPTDARLALRGAVEAVGLDIEGYSPEGGLWVATRPVDGVAPLDRMMGADAALADWGLSRRERWEFGRDEYQRKVWRATYYA